MPFQERYATHSMKNCKVCNKELVKTYYYRIPKFFCSNKCKFIDQTSGISMVERVCQFCGKDFMVRKNRGAGKFCNYECSVGFRVGKLNYVRTDEIKNKIRKSMMGKKPSKEAIEKMRIKLKGMFVKEKNPNWKGGITPVNLLIRQSTEYQDWRLAVYIRDDFTCQLCGKKSEGDIHANHIKKFSDYPELRFTLTNGITLCERCHIGIVTHHEPEWESYFNFNLMSRGFINS